jgi:hypothetical protein
LKTADRSAQMLAGYAAFSTLPRDRPLLAQGRTYRTEQAKSLFHSLVDQGLLVCLAQGHLAPRGSPLRADQPSGFLCSLMLRAGRPRPAVHGYVFGHDQACAALHSAPISLRC